MLRWISDHFSRVSLAGKLALISALTGGTALLIAGTSLVAYDHVDSRKRLVRDVGLLAEVVGANTTAALSFGDPRAATQTLSAVGANTGVVSAVILRPDGEVFARFDRDPARAQLSVQVPTEIASAGAWSRFSNGRLQLARPVFLDGQLIGRVYLETDLKELTDRSFAYVTVSAAVLAVTLLVALLMTLRLQRAVSAPLQELTDVTRRVTSDRRYDLRVKAVSDDEIGELVRGFNEMLSEIQSRDVALLEHRDHLEATVEDRTSQLRAANQQLVVEHDRAMAASHAKGEFLANMSHEIRTPMNGIIGMTELALGTSPTHEQREYLETVKDSAQALLAILNDVLDFSKIEAGKLELEMSNFSTRDVVTQAIKPFTVAAYQKNVELIANVGPNVPDYVVGDPGKLRQVLTNLIGNAVKFTEQGHVLVEVEPRDRQADRCRLHIRVVDTGIGIPQDKHESIFEAFSQADGSTTRKFGGTGLGLSISTQLVKLMGGRIWVESETGRGSAFHVEVELALGTAPAESPRPFRLPPVRILIVDDNAINRRILIDQLTQWGAEPHAAEGGQIALDVLSAAARARRSFPLVLLDMNMPDMDGLGVAEEIARRPELAGTAVAMLTSSAAAHEAERARGKGISMCLSKPFRNEELFRAIAGLLEPTARPEALAPPPAELEAPPPSSGRRVLVAEDNPVNQRLAVALLTKQGCSVTVAATGHEALAALEQDRFDLILMDLQMPGMGGLEATTVIRERERATGEHIKIVAMTAHAMPSDRDRCLAAGMDDFLTKPIDRKRLYEVVAAVPANQTTFDRDEVLDRLDGDEELLADIIQLYLDDSPRLVEDMRTAIDRGDAKALRASAHRLKGAASNLAAATVAEAARTLENLAEGGVLTEAPEAWRRLKREADQVERMMHPPPSAEDAKGTRTEP